LSVSFFRIFPLPLFKFVSISPLTLFVCICVHPFLLFLSYCFTLLWWHNWDNLTIKWCQSNAKNWVLLPLIILHKS
jgi:hypothetical protein